MTKDGIQQINSFCPARPLIILKWLSQQKEEHRDQEQRRQWDPERERGKAILDSEDQAEAAKRRLAEDRRREYEAVKSKVLRRTIQNTECFRLYNRTMTYDLWMNVM